MIPRNPKLPALLLWLLLVVAACNLNAPPPPTLEPRATSTPLPTIGFSTLSPTELPPSAATSAPSTNFELLNLLNQVEADRLLLHVDNLMRFGTRHVNSPYDQDNWGIGAAIKYITGQFQTISSQSNNNLLIFPLSFEITWGGITSRPQNIVAYITGTEIGRGTIVLGAHYDSIGIDPDDGTVLAPGADDNASGVAALLEMARILSARPHRSTIMFITFSAEEVGRLGSQAFVRDYVRPNNIDVQAMFSLDIIGSSTGPNGLTNDRELRVFSEGPLESSSRQLARMAEFLSFNQGGGLQIVVQNREDREGRYSDHLSFSEANYPAIRLIEAVENRQNQHTPRDSISDIQAGYLTRGTQTILSIVTALADGPTPPRNISLREGSSGLRTLVWEPVPGATGYIIALRPAGAASYVQFETNENRVDWDGFVPSRYAALAIAARDANGLLGPLSPELLITQ